MIVKLQSFRDIKAVQFFTVVFYPCRFSKRAERGGSVIARE